MEPTGVAENSLNQIHKYYTIQRLFCVSLANLQPHLLPSSLLATAATLSNAILVHVNRIGTQCSFQIFDANHKNVNIASKFKYYPSCASNT